MDYTNLSPSVIASFWSRVEKTNHCWNWLGPVAKRGGAPLLRKSGYSPLSPRRISLALANKPLLKNEIVLPLVCKNTICVNPDHLGIGDEARFWDNVHKFNDWCWVWTARLDRDMYGEFTIHRDGKRIALRAHVYSWELYSGRVVPKGIFVCHKCDHPYCVNPEHLFLGTTQDNTRDRDQKGRTAHVRGEAASQAKLTEQQVKEIRELSNSLPYKEIAKRYGIHYQYVPLIVNGKRWSHIK